MNKSEKLKPLRKGLGNLVRGVRPAPPPPKESGRPQAFKGFIASDDFLPEGPRTYIVFGSPRGGTTMVAGVARALGLFVGGAELNEDNNEDMLFAGRPLGEMRATIEARNQNHETWGWKFPTAGNYLADLLPQVRNPQLICVFRDSVATAQRKIGPKSLDDIGRVEWNMKRHMNNLRLLRAAKAPTMLISYEKAVLSPRPFVEAFGKRIGLSPDYNAFDYDGFLAPASYKAFAEYRKN
ncbi:MAG: hypothetical protein WD969_01050 [Paracoccaceae bacterium]